MDEVAANRPDAGSPTLLPAAGVASRKSSLLLLGLDRDGAVLHKRFHPMAMQPEKPDRELPQIVSIGSNRQATGTAQRIGGLLFQWGQIAFQ